MQLAQTALGWEYRSGPLLDYYYEKQRLIHLAFLDANEYNFITFVLLGVPDEMRKSLLSQKINSKEDLRECLKNLPAIKKKAIKTSDEAKRPELTKKSSYNQYKKKLKKVVCFIY